MTKRLKKVPWTSLTALLPSLSRFEEELKVLEKEKEKKDDEGEEQQEVKE